jgi:RNA ligase (TIGR02306 family)
MSTMYVPVKRIERVDPHPNADRLELAVVGGWQCVIPKGKYVADSLITYIPPDSILPLELSERLGVTKYLSKGRVKAAKLRGEPSFGLVIDPEGDEGENVAAKLGIEKYQPPMKFNPGEAEPSNPLFIEYTDIENLRHFPEVFTPGERVIATEKIHGTNCRLAMIREPDGTFRKLAGSRTLQRTNTENSTYWFAWSCAGVEDLMVKFAESESTNLVILFGETYGKVQAMRYGLPNGLAFRAFDLMVNGHYLDHDYFTTACITSGVEVAPPIYDGPYSLDAIRQASKGMSLIPHANHIREGVVVRPEHERRDPKIGRVILKYVSDEYLCGEYDGASE